MTDPVDQTIQQLRFVVMALMGGLVAFTITAVFMGSVLPNPRDPALSRVLMIGVAVVVMGTAMSALAIRRTLVGGLRARGAELRALADPSAQLLEPYRRLTIVSASLTEAVALFALVVYMVTKNVLAIAVAAGAVAFLFLQLPSRDRLRRFAEEVTASTG
jgi:hypothetical protein